MFEVKSERQVGDCKHFKHRQELEKKPQGKREQGVFEELKEGDCGVEVKVTTGKAGEIPQGLFLQGSVSHKTLDIIWVIV